MIINVNVSSKNENTQCYVDFFMELTLITLKWKINDGKFVYIIYFV